MIDGRKSRCTCKFKSFRSGFLAELHENTFCSMMCYVGHATFASHEPVLALWLRSKWSMAYQCLSRNTIPTSWLSSVQCVNGRTDLLCLCPPLQQSLNYSLCVPRIGVPDCISGVQFIASHRSTLLLLSRQLENHHLRNLYVSRG